MADNAKIKMITGMTVNVEKALAAICNVIGLAQNSDYLLTQYDIVKTLFLADRQHLNEYGRPITFDNYVAMNHGPVPSCSYDILKSNEYRMRQLGIEALPWKTRPIGKGKTHYFDANVDLFDQFLSDSDRDALTYAFGTVRKLSFGQIRRLTHLDPAYLDAWVEDGHRAAYDMNLALLFEEPDIEMAQDLVELSQDVRAG
ncbi:MAG: Panacea domain-containing protein [Pseudomonadota bacterium]